ncbi:MAG: hypothetical protein RDV48_01150 [Candidatus Eremiobacteraeota bacterium]|nr:hypothetical protein [Candidatus Eremiobacteraeota bacterium]
MLRFCAMILGTVILWLCAAGISCSANDPSEAYVKYLATLESAKSIKDISSCLSSARLKELDMQDREKAFKEMKSRAPVDLFIVNRIPDGKDMRLIVVGKEKLTKKECKGSVTMVLENGYWKIGREFYQSK